MSLPYAFPFWAVAEQKGNENKLKQKPMYLTRKRLSNSVSSAILNLAELL